MSLLKTCNVRNKEFSCYSAVYCFVERQGIVLWNMYIVSVRLLVLDSMEMMMYTMVLFSLCWQHRAWMTSSWQ
jgi:dolichyl-phosphate-mannose--protein O-mannosyl transferase